MWTTKGRFGNWAVGVAVAATLAVALIGCSTGLRPFADGTTRPRPPVATLPPATGAPPTQIAPMATLPPPSSAPTQYPDASTPRFPVFKKHVVQMHSDLKPVIKKLDRRLRDRDAQGSIVVLQDTREMLAEEQEWLARNQPRDCYRAVHEAWSAIVATWAEAFAVLEGALHNVDADAVERFGLLIDEGAAMLEGYKESVAPVTCGR